MIRRIECVVHGRVQGILFRDATRRRARLLGITGIVQNTDNALFVVAEGEEETLKQLLDYLKIGPPFAKVERVETVWKEYSGEFEGFNIVYSNFWDRL